ncbi:hypothetical protein [Marinifilum fragile]|uniref:hypothetical protein n=1 Tax=Marinifilum fragile TaxID=570161 RepID=UPI002AA8107F|nr:hypothetical protein [Marinifilum fragile]
MTTFSRYYNEERKLISISMEEMETLITNQENKVEIADHLYERLYTRYLKMFDYVSDESAFYEKNGEKKNQNIFNTEYKNGFLQLAACSLLVETLAGFLTGENETPNGQSRNRFNKVFEYATVKGNDLKEFKDTDFYQKIRCGILHQGETKGRYTITRNSTKIKDGDEINAHRFHKALKKLLNEYKNDLKTRNWNDEMWDCCRQKIRFIINNGR